MSTAGYESIPSHHYSQSYNYKLVIASKGHFKCCIYVSVVLCLAILSVPLLLHFLPHKHELQESPKNITLAVNLALTFFDAQKSGKYPRNSPVKFRGDSGLRDGSSAEKPADLVGGFYDSGNNIKFTFPTAYAITLLSWSVIEYHYKYADIGELEHVKDIIKWGTDYLLKVYVPPSDAKSESSIRLFSQVGSTKEKDNGIPDDITCWQRPEDMEYKRPVSICDSTASDLAGEVIAALSSASLVFKDNSTVYSTKLVDAAKSLYEVATIEGPDKHRTYTEIAACGGEARSYYNSTDYKDELLWGAAWLYFATGNVSYISYVTDSKTFSSAATSERDLDKGFFYWNNKLPAVQVLLTRIRFFHDLGSPYEAVLSESSKLTDSLMCSYLSNQNFKRTQGGLILLRPEATETVTTLQFAATASFLAKVYSDYLGLLLRSGASCGNDEFSIEMLQSFSKSQINYILGDNPMDMSYMVGFGDKYPSQVHHRSASIPWDGKHYTCKDGEKWLNSADGNPQVLLGAMVAGPDQHDNFTDKRTKSSFTDPTIAGNAGLVAALIALHDPPSSSGAVSPYLNSNNLGIDPTGIFQKSM